MTKSIVPVLLFCLISWKAGAADTAKPPELIDLAKLDPGVTTSKAIDKSAFALKLVNTLPTQRYDLPAENRLFAPRSQSTDQAPANPCVDPVAYAKSAMAKVVSESEVADAKKSAKHAVADRCSHTEFDEIKSQLDLLTTIDLGQFQLGSEPRSISIERKTGDIVQRWTYTLRRETVFEAEDKFGVVCTPYTGHSFYEITL